MPTNKKKSSGSKDKATKSATTGPASTTDKPIEQNGGSGTKNPLLLKGPQLTALILLVIGVSRNLQVRSAYAIASDGQPIKICVQHLGEAACTNDTILSLLKYKYGTALQLTILVASIVLKLWNAPDEKDLARFNTLLGVTPLLTGFLALCFSRDALDSGVLMKHLMVGIVLAVLCAPVSLQMLPFYGLGKTGSKTKAVPTLVLLSLVVWNLIQTGSYLWMTTSLTNEPTTTTTSLGWLLPVQASALQTLSLELQAAAKPIIYFLAVDCLTTAALFAYCWQVLSYQSQRSVFFMLAGTKFAEYYYLVPSIARDSIHEQLYQLEQMKRAALVTAGLAGVGWFVPDLSRLTQDDDADKKAQ